MEIVLSLIILSFSLYGFFHFTKKSILNFKSYIDNLRLQKYGNASDNPADNTSDINGWWVIISSTIK